MSGGGHLAAPEACFAGFRDVNSPVLVKNLERKQGAFTLAEGATHVVHFDGIRRTAFTLVEGATHVAHFDDIRQAAFTLVEGNTHVATSNNLRRAAFTLAEVLITLGIIGVVAALTMPSLIQRYKDQVLIAQSKKSYSNFMNVLNRMLADTGSVDYSSIFAYGDGKKEDVAKAIASYYNGAKVCESSGKGCGSTYIVKLAKPTNDGTGGVKKESFGFPRLLLVDGSSISFRDIRQTCEPWTYTSNVKDENGFNTGETETITDTRCATVVIDVNGANKGPNQYGADVHQIIVQPQKLQPSSGSYGALKTIFLKNKLDYERYSENKRFD